MQRRTEITKTIAILVLGLAVLGMGAANAALPTTENGVTTIHLEQHNGYFAARETLTDLKVGTNRFVVSNEAGKVVGFQIQDFVTHETLDMFPLEPGETKSTTVTITENGFRYRCPINPTPWYGVDNIKAQ